MCPRPENPVGAEARASRQPRPSRHHSLLSMLCALCGSLSISSSAQAFPSAVEPGIAHRLAAAVFPLSPPSDTPGGVLLAADALLRRAASPEHVRLPAQTRLHRYSERWVRSQGQRYRLALWEATPPASAGATTQPAAILALFAEAGADPLDVLEVKTDLHTRFGDAASPPLGEDETFSIVNHRSHSPREFAETALFHVHGDRLRHITSIFTQAMQGSCSDTYRQVLHWTTESDDSPYPRLSAHMEMQPAPPADGVQACSPRPSRHQQVGLWRWHPVRERYEAVGSGQFAHSVFQ